MHDRFLSLLGLARRAGKVASGEAQVEAFLKKKKGCLLIVAEDAPNAFAKFSPWAKDLNIPVLVTGKKRDLGHAIGLSPRSVILITDEGFAKAIMKARG